MAEEVEVVENGSNAFTRVGDLVHKTFMVGLGTVGLVQDELVKIWDDSGAFIEKLEERGEAMSKDGREKLDAQREKLNSQIETRQDQVKDLGSKANETIEKASGTVLTTVNVPTADDIQDLSKQISALNRKVDKVRKEQQELAAAQA
jgi:poly(hydroxyalkanoate) granule-associated protein